MKNIKVILILAALIIFFAGCAEKKSLETNINKEMFEHHFITQDLPGVADWGYGCPVLADFDKDGDLDYSFSRIDQVFWFENNGDKTWKQHIVGDLVRATLGANGMDVDKDGWMDIIVGGYWFRNALADGNDQFEKYQYDNLLKAKYHDIVPADINGDGVEDFVGIGESDGVYWYQIPEEPLKNENWNRTLVTLDVLHENDHIHGGFFPKGINDLDGDGDNDIVLPDRWLENKSNGQEWVKHQLPFGKRGPYGLSSRSWIIDLDEDGDNDIVMTDCDQQASRAAWLENHGEATPTFTAHFLPMTATGIRGSFHTLYVGDLDNDGDNDILTCDQEDDSLPTEGATPRWYVWENISTSSDIKFVEKVILDNKLGGHDALVGDADGDGDLDIFSKVWNLWPGSGNNGVEHGDFLENKIN